MLNHITTNQCRMLLQEANFIKKHQNIQAKKLFCNPVLNCRTVFISSSGYPHPAFG